MEDAFKRWLRDARKGERYVYHIGYLPRDRTRMVEVPVIRGEVHLMAVNHGPIHHLAQLVMAAADADMVHLVQRRVNEDRFEYIAEKR